MSDFVVSAPPAREEPLAMPGSGDLVNRLAQELAHAQRALSASQQKLGAASRSLATRTQELSESRAALALLLATLDATSDGILAFGHFGRAMHYNTRFVEMWRIAPEKMSALNESALLALQLAQVSDPQGFLTHFESRKAHPEQEHRSLVALTDGRIFECQVRPQLVRGRRMGCITLYRDVTERERLLRLTAALQDGVPPRA